MSNHDRLLRGIRATARMGDVCPSNEDLAAFLGLDFTAEHAAALLSQLAKQGRVVIRRSGRRRIVAAPDGSWATATPDGWLPDEVRATVREQALAQLKSGISLCETAKRNGVAIETLRGWRDGAVPRHG